jgi:hypothetical protein
MEQSSSNKKGKPNHPVERLKSLSKSLEGGFNKSKVVAKPAADKATNRLGDSSFISLDLADLDGSYVVADGRRRYLMMRFGAAEVGMSNRWRGQQRFLAQ